MTQLVHTIIRITVQIKCTNQGAKIPLSISVMYVSCLVLCSSKQSGNLVIPEKSASFSIHPGRLCSDVCSYCFGKFGSLDTPCHIAQLKSSERQQKVLQGMLF